MKYPVYLSYIKTVSDSTTERPASQVTAAGSSNGSQSQPRTTGKLREYNNTHIVCI